MAILSSSSFISDHQHGSSNPSFFFFSSAHKRHPFILRSSFTSDPGSVTYTAKSTQDVPADTDTETDHEYDAFTHAALCRIRPAANMIRENTRPETLATRRRDLIQRRGRTRRSSESSGAIRPFLPSHFSVSVQQNLCSNRLCIDMNSRE